MEEHRLWYTLTEVQTLLRDAGEYRAQGKSNEALHCYEEASKRIQGVLDSPTALEEGTRKELQETVAYCLNNIGEVYQAQGALEQALDCYGKALAIIERVAPNSQNHATYLNNIGFVHDAKGDLGQALRYYLHALEIDCAIDPQSQATATDLNNIGSVYYARGEFKRALDKFLQALEIDRTIDPLSQATATDFNNIGAVYQAQGDLERALRYYRKALRVIEQIAPNSQSRVTYLNNIGLVYQVQGALGQALRYYRRALRMIRRVAPNSQLHTICLNNVGYAYYAQGELRRALRYHREALKVIEQIVPGSQLRATYLNNLGMVCLALGDLKQAITHLMQAVQVAESLRARAGGARAKEQLFVQHQSPYQALIACLYERNGEGDRAQAFHYAERSRARTMLELLAERQLNIQPETDEQRQLLERERALQFRFAAKHNQLIALRQNPQTPPERIEQLEREERELETQLEQAAAEIRRVFPAYAQLEYPEPLTLEQVQQRVLDPGVLLLEYATTGKKAFVWAVRQDGFEMVPLPQTGKQIAELVVRAIGRYHGAGTPEPMEQGALQQLADALLGVVPAELWEGVSRVIVVPDGALYFLPFELLPLPDGRLLGEAYPIVYAPSATVLDNLRQMWDRCPAPVYEGDFVGFGDPLFGDGEADNNRSTAAHRFAERGLNLRRLPGTRVEVENIAQRFGERAAVYLQEQATEYRAKIKTRGYRYVHFATHGLLDDRSPLHSGLALSPPLPDEPEHADDLLQVWEMFGLKLDAEVVVLSACQTGLGALRAGEGLVGMSRALFFAGAKCLVVSLWNVPDLHTAQLMQWFYEELGTGKSVVEALQAAKARMRALKPDAYYWAAFIPIGLAW